MSSLLGAMYKQVGECIFILAHEYYLGFLLDMNWCTKAHESKYATVCICLHTAKCILNVQWVDCIHIMYVKERVVQFTHQCAKHDSTPVEMQTHIATVLQ